MTRIFNMKESTSVVLLDKRKTCSIFLAPKNRKIRPARTLASRALRDVLGRNFYRFPHGAIYMTQGESYDYVRHIEWQANLPCPVYRLELTDNELVCIYERIRGLAKMGGWSELPVRVYVGNELYFKQTQRGPGSDQEEVSSEVLP